MPNLIPKGRPHVLPQRWARRIELFAQSLDLIPSSAPDAGTGQRAAIARKHMDPLGVVPVAGSPSAVPAETFSGETKAAQVISPRPGIDQADPVAGVSAHGAGMPPVLPSARRRPPVT